MLVNHASLVATAASVESIIALFFHQVNFSSVPHLITKQSILAGFVEGYVVTAQQLPYLLKCTAPLPETHFKERVISAAQKRVYNGTAIRGKSCRLDRLAVAALLTVKPSYFVGANVKRCFSQIRKFLL